MTARLLSSLLPHGWVCIALAFVLALPGWARAADASDLSKETQACLKCHDKPSLSKTLQNGESMSLHISTEAFVASRHAENECEDCHADLDGATHGKVKTDIASHREFSMGMRDSCVECHKKKVKAYDDGVHAALVAGGSKKAPLCSDCHNPHTQRSVKLLQPIEQLPCAKCHKDIFKAYSGDVHGLDRVAKGKEAPACPDCHKAHEIKAASFGTGIRDACLGCHEDAADKHKDWLPNAARHFDAISCPACHAPTAKRRVNLRLFDADSNKQLMEKRDLPFFAERTAAADKLNQGLDGRALRGLLKEYNDGNADAKVVLRGRLEVESGVQAHQIAEKSEALRDCKTCHSSGSSAFQSVSLTVAGPDGRPLRHSVQNDVLTSLTSIESVRGFYAIGATRISLLDWLLLLAVLGAGGGVAAHASARWYFRRQREKQAAHLAGEK